MQGITDHYAVDPNCEIVLGLVTHGAMLARRQRRRHVVSAGEVCLWDASAKHEGIPYRTTHWAARLIVIEAQTIHELWDEGSSRLVQGLTRRVPVIHDAELARRFASFHEVLHTAVPPLAVEAGLLELLAFLSGERDSRISAARGDPALRRAYELLVAEAHRNITLRELAAEAGTNRHRLTRLFRAAYGLPPHRLQLAVRIARARRLLEQGEPVAEVAQQVGFADQSHFHRYFRRTLGIPPGRYARQTRSNVQDGAGLRP